MVRERKSSFSRFCTVHRSGHLVAVHDCWHLGEFPSSFWGPVLFFLISFLFSPFDSLATGQLAGKSLDDYFSKMKKKPCLRYFFRILPVKSCHSDHFRRYFFVRRYYRLCLIYMNGRLLLSSTGRWWWLVNQCPTLVRWGKPKSNGEKKFFLKRKKKYSKRVLFLYFFLSRYYYDGDFPPCNLCCPARILFSFIEDGLAAIAPQYNTTKTKQKTVTLI